MILISFKPRFRPNTKYLKLSTSRLLEDTAARAVLKDTTSGLHAKLASEACISTGNAGKSIVIKGGNNAKFTVKRDLSVFEDKVLEGAQPQERGVLPPISGSPFFSPPIPFFLISPCKPFLANTFFWTPRPFFSLQDNRSIGASLYIASFTFALFPSSYTCSPWKVIPFPPFSPQYPQCLCAHGQSKVSCVFLCATSQANSLQKLLPQGNDFATHTPVPHSSATAGM